MSELKRHATQLSIALFDAAEPAASEAGGMRYARQWKAGHYVAMELLGALATGQDVSEVVARWSLAAGDEEDLTPLTTSERNGLAPPFRWDPYQVDAFYNPPED